MEKLVIYFDYVKVNGSIVVGTASYESEKSLRSSFKGINVVEGKEVENYNQFHSSIRALQYALNEAKNWIDSNNIKEIEITLLNQNSLIFDWLLQQSFDVEYEELFMEVYDTIEEMVETTDFRYKVIKGKDNKAKKLLKSESCRLCNASVEMDFSGLGERFKKKHNTENKSNKNESNIYLLRANEF